VWAANATGGGDTVAALLTDVGRKELARAVSMLLALWALLLVRRPAWAAAFAWLAVGVAAVIGHASAMSPALLIPLKLVHLASCALWLGGLLVLLSGPDAEIGSGAVDAAGSDAFSAADGTAFAETALRISQVALVAIILIAITGLAQTLIVVRPAQLLTSRYGLLSLAKLAVLVVLVALGALNRFRNLPAIQRGAMVRSLQRTVLAEIVAIAAAFMIAGFLAYTSPPGMAHAESADAVRSDGAAASTHVLPQRRSLPDA
jgi:putative copper export protein